MNKGSLDKSSWSLIRDAHRGSDRIILVISIMLGCLTGYWMSKKIGLLIGFAFAFFAICTLYFMWRNPDGFDRASK